MSATRTSPEQALVGESEGGRLDVLRLFCVPVDTVVRRPSTVRRALLELSGVPLAELKLDGAGQTLVESAPVRLETRVPPLPGGPVALPVSAETAFLSPTMSLQCNDRDVRAKAGAIVGGLTDATAAARALERWVFENLRKEATASFPNAVAVLRSMSGDCNEHAVLYAALARAAGIPARLAVGLVYLDGAFYYHAWDEVYLGHWVSVDPTFGEFPAGALRIRLGGGEVGQQAEILGLVRRIQIRLVEFE
jgi:transglutaminase-like putative cysteine protease